MRILALACLGLALSQLGSAAGIYLKAELAQVLIARAWRESGPARPWPRADTWPIARLQFPGRGVDLYVLTGAGGHALAFGPGHLSGSARPGGAGTAVIGGHRDTHFAFLRHVGVGERLLLTDKSGQTRRYRVQGTRIADTRRGPLQAAGEGLILVTCFPFDAVAPGGPLRYLVLARPE
jgi:sortase A